MLVVKFDFLFKLTIISKHDWMGMGAWELGLQTPNFWLRDAGLEISFSLKIYNHFEKRLGPDPERRGGKGGGGGGSENQVPLAPA